MSCIFQVVANKERNIETCFCHSSCHTHHTLQYIWFLAMQTPLPKTIHSNFQIANFSPEKLNFAINIIRENMCEYFVCANWLAHKTNVVYALCVYMYALALVRAPPAPPPTMLYVKYNIVWHTNLVQTNVFSCVIFDENFQTGKHDILHIQLFYA